MIPSLLARYPSRQQPRVSLPSKAIVPRIRSALLRSRGRDSAGDGAYRLLGSLTTASQLTTEMLAETRRTGKRLSRILVAVRGAERVRLGHHRPLVVPLRRQHRGGERHPPGCGIAAIAREAVEGPVRADAKPCQASRVLPAGQGSTDADVRRLQERSTQVVLGSITGW